MMHLEVTVGGLDRVIALIQEQITRLEDAGIAVFILSHVKEKTRTDMVTGEEYQVWTNNLMDKVYGAIADTAQDGYDGGF